MTYLQQPLQPIPSNRVETQALPSLVSILVTALFAIWVIQQGIKLFRGEEIERPF
jgi:hypothetical protein